ncbi:4Fe-4S binding protein [uncultured Megasphaera sp.]|uniref:4Fe-4S binding protein n=1 Tax=uncultured Megasphaera sp. TaxID=165188 RepID=UPI00258EE2C0|nr:4Fe-4S binding protein [uncultured Megasphaera sp.]
MRNMLQRGRIVLSWLLMGAMVLTFAGIVAPVLPQWQVLPALLAGNLLVIAVIIVLTLLLGRIYCSVLCPLGISQDFVFWLAKRRKKNRRKFTFRRERRIVRYSILMLTGLAFLAGLSGFVGLVDPYSIFGRIVHDGLGLPVAYGWNALVGVNESHGWIPVLSKTDILWPPLAAMALAGVYFVVLTVLAWRYGRAYCHTVCPVGTLLGTLSRFSLFRPVIDGLRCIHCGACEKTCRSSCIDVAHGFVDTSRCVDCFELSGEGISRREMLLTTAVAAGTIAAGLARSQTVVPALMGTGKGKKKILPPGAVSADAFAQRCTACHLCVSRCPSGVLVPAVLENGALQMGQPYMDFSKGYCVYNCNFCSQACPAGAIRPLELAVKEKTKIGIARYAQFHCLIARDGIVCGNCARHCPVQAITMVENNDGRSYPHVDGARCIGCGSCEYHCPAKPAAISVSTLPKSS